MKQLDLWGMKKHTIAEFTLGGRVRIRTQDYKNWIGEVVQISRRGGTWVYGVRLLLDERGSSGMNDEILLFAGYALERLVRI